MMLLRFACTAAVGLMSVGAFAGSAVAGSFAITQCMPPAGAHSFSPLNPSQFSTLIQCPAASGEVFSGLVAQDSLGSGGYANGARGGYVISAAPGTTITSITGRRHFGKRSVNWNVGVRTAEGQVLETCSLDPLTQLSCERGNPTTPTDPDNDFAYTALSTSGLAFDFICQAPGATTCPRTPSQHGVWMVLYDATLTIDDPSPPTLGTLDGTLLGPGGTAGWHRGSESATLQASDASGIKQARLVVDEQTRAQASKVCDYSRPLPCPGSATETFTLDLGSIGDGTHTLRFGATDAAGQETLSAPQPLRIDHAAPGAPQGLSATRNPDASWRLRWTNPVQGTAAPIVAAHYLVCQPGSSTACPTGAVTSGPQISELDATLPLGGGPWDILVWLQDEAGNQLPATAARIAVNTSSQLRPPAVLAPSAPGPSAKLKAGLKVTRALRRGRQLYVEGTLRKAATSELALSVCATQRGRILARGTTRPRRGHWRMRVGPSKAMLASRRLYITVRYRGDRVHASQVITRHLVRRAARISRSTPSGNAEFRIEP